MPSYPFLSDEWLDEARKIRAEYEGKTAPIPHVVRMNLVVTAVPFSDDDILAHLDTSSGELVLDTGHLETQDLKVTVDYDTAKAILVEGNPQAGMQAFMAGKVRVEGDMAKLMALQAAPAAADPNAAEMATTPARHHRVARATAASARRRPASWRGPRRAAGSGPDEERADHGQPRPRRRRPRTGTLKLCSSAVLWCTLPRPELRAIDS